MIITKKPSNINTSPASTSTDYDPKTKSRKLAIVIVRYIVHVSPTITYLAYIHTSSKSQSEALDEKERTFV